MKKKTEQKDNVKINLVIKKDRILNEFACEQDYILNTQIEDFISDQVQYLKRKSTVTLQVEAKEEDRDVFVTALHKTYERKIAKAAADIKRKRIMSVIMLLTGILILLGGYFLDNSSLAFEIFLVASWVFIWRAVELWFFEVGEIGLSIFRNKKILNSNIEFRSKLYYE